MKVSAPPSTEERQHLPVPTDQCKFGSFHWESVNSVKKYCNNHCCLKNPPEVLSFVPQEKFEIPLFASTACIPEAAPHCVPDNRLDLPLLLAPQRLLFSTSAAAATPWFASNIVPVPEKFPSAAIHLKRKPFFDMLLLFPGYPAVLPGIFQNAGSNNLHNCREKPGAVFPGCFALPPTLFSPVQPYPNHNS